MIINLKADGFEKKKKSIFRDNSEIFRLPVILPFDVVYDDFLGVSYEERTEDIYADIYVIN